MYINNTIDAFSFLFAVWQDKMPILDSPYYVFVALCIVVIVVSLIFKMAYFLPWPVQEPLKKARVKCTIANSKIFAKTFNIFIRSRNLYQCYHYNHNAKRYENVIGGLINFWFTFRRNLIEHEHKNVRRRIMKTYSEIISGGDNKRNWKM
jgi:glucan phosphoethanolaminetransferase (alkaline phosphatase superfamily)